MRLEEFYKKVGREWQCPRCAYSTMHDSRAVNHARLHGVKIGIEQVGEPVVAPKDQAAAVVMEMAVETAPGNAENADLAVVKGKNRKI
jgi:hypothetical protein